MNVKTRNILLLTMIAGIVVLMVRPLWAHELTLAKGSTNCGGYCLSFAATGLTAGDADKITYTLILTPNAGGQPITVSGEVAFVASGDSYSTNICGNWLSSGQSLTDNYTVTGTATLVTPGGEQSTLTIDFGGGGALMCGTPPPGKTFSMSNSMEGDLSKIRPGDWISGGYSFKFVDSKHVGTTYTVTTSIKLPVYCPDGGGPGGDIIIPLGTQTYGIGSGYTDWVATGDQNSILAWEGAVQAPNLCSGNRMRNQIGATFNATVSQNPQVGLVDWRFHYRDPAAKGKPNTNCTDATDPNRNRADVCGASWSQTFRDP